MKLVLVHAAKKLGEQNLTELISDSINEIGETDSPRIITGVLIELARERVGLCAENLKEFATFVEDLDSPELKVESFRSLGVLYSLSSSHEADCWFKNPYRLGVY